MAVVMSAAAVMVFVLMRMVVAAVRAMCMAVIVVVLAVMPMRMFLHMPMVMLATVVRATTVLMVSVWCVVVLGYGCGFFLRSRQSVSMRREATCSVNRCSERCSE